MDQYPLRNIPDDLWRAVRVRTTADGITIKDVIVRALEVYAKHGQAALWTDEKKAPKRRTA